VGERVPDAQTSFTPSFDTAYFTLLAKSPIQNILVNGVDLTGMIMLDAFTLGCRGSIRVVDEGIVCHDQKQGDRSSSRVRDRHLVVNQLVHHSIMLLNAYTNARNVRI
jgi:hypothetical protein